MLVTLPNIAYCHINEDCSIAIRLSQWKKPTSIIAECMSRECSVLESIVEKVRILGLRIHGANKIQYKKTSVASNTTKTTITLLALIDSSRYCPLERPPFRPQPPFSCMTCFHARTCMRRPFPPLSARVPRSSSQHTTIPGHHRRHACPHRHLRIQRCYRQHAAARIISM